MSSLFLVSKSRLLRKANVYFWDQKSSTVDHIPTQTNLVKFVMFTARYSLLLHRQNVEFSIISKHEIHNCPMYFDYQYNNLEGRFRNCYDFEEVSQIPKGQIEYISELFNLFSVCRSSQCAYYLCFMFRTVLQVARFYFNSHFVMYVTRLENLTLQTSNFCCFGSFYLTTVQFIRTSYAF
jgi:hypothetical protein